MKLERKCGDCRFYEPQYNECRRNAPVVVPVSTSSDAYDRTVIIGQTLFPELPPEQWCGEFQMRKVTD